MAETAKQLTGKVAVVTGASQGLGEQLALELAAHGAAVAVAARNGERLGAIRGAIEARGGRAAAVPTDLSSESDCKALIERVHETLGPIDILVLNAGTATFGKLEELTGLDAIRDSMAVNFFGAAYPTYYALDDLIARKGLVAYVTSGSGHLPMAGYLGYSTSKHAMNGFFECLRLEMYPHGVDVLMINPGDMYSDDGAGRTFFTPEGEELKIDLSIKRQNDIKRHPASSVAKKCSEAIIDRRRELDLSPRIQKLATRTRPFVPALIDRIIYERVSTLRSAFTGEVEQRQKVRQEAA
jgi:NAD(P)-dependent dehydrogenase (short-subunit alcohol dehydrogenase family)